MSRLMIRGLFQTNEDSTVWMQMLPSSGHCQRHNAALFQVQETNLCVQQVSNQMMSQHQKKAESTRLNCCSFEIWGFVHPGVSSAYRTTTTFLLQFWHKQNSKPLLKSIENEKQNHLVFVTTFNQKFVHAGSLRSNMSTLVKCPSFSLWAKLL